MQMGLPTITVEFKALATTAVTRSARGVLAVIVQDATEGVTWTSKTFTSADELTEKEFTKENIAILTRAFLAGPYQVLVVRVGAEGTMDQAGTILDKLAYHWVCAVPSGFQSGLVAYVKKANTTSRIRKVKALVAGVTNADDPHIANLANATVTPAGGDGTTVTATDYLPRVGGILAACPLTESVTYYGLDDLDAVAEVSDLDTTIDGGNLCLFLDDNTIRIARGVNTLKTVTGDLTEDMKKIAVVEAMDLIQEDIIRTFKTGYLGKVKNSADNQALFVSDVLLYLQTLEAENVLDKDQPATVEVDVNAMRAAWEKAGTSVADLTDAQVKRKTYRSYVYVTGTCHVLDAMEDLSMAITLG